MNTSIKQLSSGYEVEVRAVPPTAYLDVELEFNRNHPPPMKPTIKVQSVAGHTEELLASMNSPEWAQYDNALELHKADLRAHQINFAYNYAVVKWHKSDSLSRLMESERPELKAWQIQPPGDWFPDELCPDKTSSRRILFIKYELINSIKDDGMIGDPFKVSPLSDQEVEAALDKFRPDTASEAVTASPVKRKGSGK